VIPKIGAHFNVSFEEYSRWEATNWHTLEPFRRSPKHARFSMDRPQDATKSMILCGAFHTAILEPVKFDRIYSVMPDFDGNHNSKAYKDKKNAWLENHSEAVTIDTKELARLRAMQRELSAHPVASAILKARGRNEISIVWKDKDTGELCKGRIDRLCRIPAAFLDPNASGEVLALVDFKGTAFIDRFDNEVAKFGYFGQIAMYEDGLKTIEPASITPMIVAIEDVPPFDIAVHTCADAVEHGRRLYRRLLDELIRCRKAKSWPGIAPMGTIPIVLPQWARERENAI
jgi:exodeoxyribonuclease VIII